MRRMQKYPTTAAAMIPTSTGAHSMACPLEIASFASNTLAPKIAGMPRIKLNFTQNSFE